MKGCLILGPKSVTWYKDGYPLLKSKELFIGHHGRLEDEGIWLEDKDGVPAKVLCLWYTTLTVKDYDKPFVLTKSCESQEYQVYDNYNAIEIKRIGEIPYDYDGPMGVPTSFFKYQNELDDYEVLEKRADLKIKGKKLFQRLIIQKRK